MRLNERLDYPAAPDHVYAMVTDKAFRDDVCEATGAVSWSVEVDNSPDGAEYGAAVTVRRVLPADVPEMMKRLVGETIEVVQTEQWESADGDSRRAEVLVEIADQPARMIGTAVIEPAGDGASLTLEGDVKVAVPMLGGRLEKEVTKVIQSALRIEQRRGVRYLSV